MGIYYYKLFDLLNRRGMKKGDLIELAGISNATMAKLSKHKVVQTDIIDRICSALNCQPADIMEFVKTEDTSNEENEE
jgi:putative transcriptional regulator